jgi:hypothetical protein
MPSAIWKREKSSARLENQEVKNRMKRKMTFHNELGQGLGAQRQVEKNVACLLALLCFALLETVVLTQRHL